MTIPGLEDRSRKPEPIKTAILIIITIVFLVIIIGFKLNWFGERS